MPPRERGVIKCSGIPCGQYISKKRPSGFVIPSLRSRASSERSEGSLSGERSFAPLRMTLLNRFRLTRKTSYLKCIVPCGDLVWGTGNQDRRKRDGQQAK